MSKLTIYQKPSCSTCRDVMRKLSAAGVDYDAINYIIEPPSREKLVELMNKMGATARDIIRTKEPVYRELGLGDERITNDELIDTMIDNPGLIQRPILEYGDIAVLGRPAEKVDEFIERMREA